MVKVIFLGSRPLGSSAIEVLRSISGVDIVGAITREPSPHSWWNKDPFYEDIKKISFEDMYDADFDIGISINYWKIIPPELIRKPKMGFLNLHHSYNLSLRGRDMTSHAILNARDSGKWYHGTTLHYTDDGLDTGPIIASASCPIDEWDTSWTLFHKVEVIGLDLLRTWLPRAIKSTPPLVKPDDNQPLNLRKRVQPLRYIEVITRNPLKSYDTVRAFDFNGYYSPAWTIINGKNVDLFISDGLGRELILEAGEGRNVYCKYE